MSFTTRYMCEVGRLALEIEAAAIDEAIRVLHDVRSSGGLVYTLGLGGGAGNASHAAADLVNLAGMTAMCVTDNVSWLTATINDHGWDYVFVQALSAMTDKDALLVFSVGGGSISPEVSVPIVRGVRCAKDIGAKVIGITSRRDGETQKLADVLITVPAVSGLVTPMVESFQAVIWHLIVSHPLLNVCPPLWEGFDGV